jgi:hypothetical protein
MGHANEKGQLTLSRDGQTPTLTATTLRGIVRQVKNYNAASIFCHSAEGRLYIIKLED